MTYGQWHAQMSSQVANEAKREYYDAKTDLLKQENVTLKCQVKTLELLLQTMQRRTPNENS